MRTFSIFPLFTLASFGRAEEPSKLLPAPCFEACQMMLRPIKFTDSDGGVPRVKQCRSELAIKSLYLCTKLYCLEENRVEGLDAQNLTCQTSLQVSLPPWDIVANYTEDDLVRLTKFEEAEYESGSVFSEAAIPSSHLFNLAYSTLDAWSYAYTNHFLYGSYMFVFWILVGTIGVSTRIVASLGRKPAIERSGWQQITLREPVREDQTAFKCLNWIRTPSVWLGRHITLPATFGYRASQNFGWYTVPPRIQTLTILAFTVINIVLCVHGYRVFRGNLYFPEVHTQVWRYLSDRTGIISFANFPLIWLFGMRNNLLLWVTGWDFGTYNNFHRWIARIATLEAVVHSIGYTILVFEDGGWSGFVDYWKELWWTTGEIATILMCALIPLSLYWMRRNTYELFLVLHILLSVVILAAMWGHVTIFKERYEVVAWICFGIWALDRVLRLVRTLAFNRVPFSTRARATFDPATNMIRLSVPCKTSLYQPTPGTFYYLSVLNDRRFWESHPFTMAKYQTGTDEKRGMGTTEQFLVASETTRLLPQAAADISTASKPSRESAGAEERTMTFLIRPYDGFTKRLRDAASSTYPHPAYLPILVEGPYGHQRNFDRFDHVVFVVGGSGIVVPLVHLQRLCHSRAGTRSVHILWAVREPAFAMSVLQQDMAESSGKFGSRLLDLNVYITGPQQPEQPLDLPGEVRVYHGRPDVNAMVRGYAQDYSHQGTLAVVSCGPAKMNDDTRRAVVHSLGMGRFALEYFEESFNW